MGQMYKKDFVALAARIRRAVAIIEGQRTITANDVGNILWIVQAVCDFCRDQNGKFDGVKFKEACGIKHLNQLLEKSNGGTENS